MMLVPAPPLCCDWNQPLGHWPASSSHTALRLSHGDLGNVHLLLDKMCHSDTAKGVRGLKNMTEGLIPEDACGCPGGFT